MKNGCEKMVLAAAVTVIGLNGGVKKNHQMLLSAKGRSTATKGRSSKKKSRNPFLPYLPHLMRSTIAVLSPNPSLPEIPDLVVLCSTVVGLQSKIGCAVC